jgi:chitinase
VLSPNDTSNFLLFLQELRGTSHGKKLILTAATPLLPWMDENGENSADVSPFAKIFDYIAIMNYDVWGSWSSGVGPNAPLMDSCAAEENQQGSGDSAVSAWVDAGMPESKIVLGVPSYGHSFSVNATSAFNGTDKLQLYPAFNTTYQPAGDATDSGAGVDQCGNEVGASGSWLFWGMVRGGWLNLNGTVAEGLDYLYDECSQTVSYQSSLYC